MKENLVKIIGFFGSVLLNVVLLGLPTMWLWNILMVDLFDLSKIVFSQAVGLNVLASIFFKQSNK